MAILGWLAAPELVQAASLQLGFTAPTSVNESNRQVVLEWNAEAAKTYLVQSADDLSSGSLWKTEEPVLATKTGPVRWMAPEALKARKFYRLILPQPAVFSVEPAFIDSSDSSALFYITGQSLPADGTVVVNGQNFSPVSVDPNGAWLAVSLDGLPSGTPVIGNILVLDSGSNIVTTLPVQSPVLYGTEMTGELLQGPPDEPPASAARKGYDYYKARSDIKAVGRHHNLSDSDNSISGEMPSLRGHHRGHVTVLKAHEDEFDGVGIFPATGELRCQETDLFIPGRGLDFAWVRTYRSRTGPTTEQGAGWDYSYNVSVSAQPDGTVVLRPGNGRADTFYPNGTNGWTRDEYFLEIQDLDRDGHPDVVAFADGGRWLLHPPGSPMSGKLAQIVDRNNNLIRCEYDDITGRLLRVVDTLNRTNVIAYDAASGRIESVTDFSGRVVRYEYNGNGDLTACVSPAVTGTPNGNDFPGGKTNQYAYSSGLADPRLNHNLTGMTDPKGQTWLQIIYHPTNNPAAIDFDAVATVLRGIDRQDIRRGMLAIKPGSPPHTQAIINDGVGNVCEYYYDSRHRLARVREFTGRANPNLPTTATENRPTNKLRSDDPDYFETNFEWNPDSLCTRVVYPAGNSTEMVYERAFNQNAARSNRRHAGDLRVLRERACCNEDADGDGFPDTLVTTFEYDVRFGSPASSNKKLFVGGLPYTGAPKKSFGQKLARITGRGSVATGRTETGAVPVQGWDDRRKSKTYEKQKDSDVISRKGWDGTVKGSTHTRVITDREPGRSKGFAFVISTTDPRGGVTTAEYDANGNLMRMRKRPELLYQAWENDFAHNSHGQLTAVTNAADANGFRRVDTFTYYSSGPQNGYLEAEVCDDGNLGLTTRYEYDACGNVTRMVDARGSTNEFTWNALNQLIERQTQQSSFGTKVKTTFTYDANGNLIACDEDNQDSDGVLDPVNPRWTTRWGFDTLDRCVEVVAEIAEGGGLPASFATNRFVYDANDNLITAQSPLAVSGADPNSFTQLEYDERDLRFRAVSAPGTGQGATNQWDYDPNANPRASKVDSFTVKQMAYDGFDRTVAVTDALSNLVLFAYDRNDNLISARVYAETNDVPGDAGNLRYHEWLWRYDALDRCVEARTGFFDPATQAPIGDGASSTTFSRAPNGQCLTITDDNGHTTRFAYDTVGRLASVTDPKTNLVSYTYDECDNVLSVTKTDRSDLGGTIQQFTMVNGYDFVHRLTRSVDNVGNTNLYAYDSRDNLVRHTDPRGNSTFYAYDGLDRCTLAIGDLDGDGIPELAADAQQTYVYDANSRLVASTDDNTNTTFFAYDSLNRLIQTTHADGTRQSLIWSPRSNLVREQDANGTVISNRFDLLDRCVRRDITPGAGVAATTTFEVFAYDGLSRLVSASNDTTEVRFAYDSLGNGVRATAGGFGALTTTHDGVGNPLSLMYPSGRLVTFTYDALDQVTSMSSSTGGLPLAGLSTFAYDGPGRLGRIARTNAVNSRYQWNGLMQPANAPGDFGWQQVSGINHQIAGGGTVIDRRAFSYDRNQNKTSRAQTLPFFAGGFTTTNLFAYDALDRLTSFDRFSESLGNLTKAYVLDGNGNRLGATSNGIFAPYIMDATQPDPADFQMNQYTLTPFVVAPEQYDQNGNLIVRMTATAHRQFVYDYADRLVQVADLSSGFPVPIVTYSYDALGRRVGRVINPGAPGQFVSGYAVYWGESALEEHENGTLRRTYAFPHVFEQKGRVMFTDTGDPLHFLCDDLDNTLALTDADGNIVERYDYDDYGAPYFLTVDGSPTGETESGVGNPFLFAGMRWDSETGFYEGCYDPANGRGTGRLRIDGGMPNRIAMNVTTPKQTQGATFGTRVKGGLAVALGHNPWSGGGPKAQDHNSSRSNTTASRIDSGGSGGSGSKAQDHNSSRSNTTASKAQDHNSSRSNTTASGIVLGGGGGSGGNFPNAMNKGMVKFFNETEGFGLTRLLESIQDESKGFSSLIR